MILKQYYQNFLSTTQRSDTVTLESAFRAGYLTGLERAAVECDGLANELENSAALARYVRSLKEHV